MKLLHESVHKVNEDATLERLKKIACATNEYISRGEECVVCLGHSGDDQDQLAVTVGSACNFVVEGEVLYADLEIDDIWEDQRELKGYRKKSMEVWVDGVCSVIALLAKNRSALELGTIKYQAIDRNQEKETLTYTNNEDLNMLSQEELKQLIAEELLHSEAFSKVNHLLENLIPVMQERLKKLDDTLAPLMAEEEAEMGGETPEAGMEGEAGVEDEVAAVENIEAEHDAGKAEEAVAAVEEAEGEEDELEKNMASDSANNTYVPGLEDKKAPELANKKKNVQKYQMLIDDLQAKMLKSEQEKNEILTKVEEEKEELVVKYQMEVRKNELNELAKTHNFDPLEEIGIVSQMNDKQWNSHKNIIVTKYQKCPVGRTISVGNDVEDRQVVKPERVSAAIKLCQSEGIDFKTALTRV